MNNKMTKKNQSRNNPHDRWPRESGGSPHEAGTMTTIGLLTALMIGGGAFLASSTPSYYPETASQSSNVTGYSGVKSPHCYLKAYSKDNCMNSCHSKPTQNSNNSRNRHYRRRHRKP